MRVPAGDWVILVNTDISNASQMVTDLNSLYNVEGGFGPLRVVTDMDGMRLIQHSMVRDYAALMEMQVAGMAGPTWYR